jgi:hypothetical protein
MQVKTDSRFTQLPQHDASCGRSSILIDLNSLRLPSRFNLAFQEFRQALSQPYRMDLPIATDMDLFVIERIMKRELQIVH